MHRSAGAQMFSTEEAIALNKRGLLIGPGESDTAFFARIQKQLAYVLTPPHIDARLWEGVRTQLQVTFDIVPDWLPVFCSHKGIRSWEAAATWDDQGVAVVQLHPKLLVGNVGFATREEILAHEATHAARNAYRETRFEEILCYKTSTQRWRRYFGPLFRTTAESMTSLVSLLGGSVYYIVNDSLWGFLPHIFLLVGVLCRLGWDQHVFTRCVRTLSQVTHHPLALTLRLSDQEIVAFSRLPPSSVLEYAQQQSTVSSRWKALYACYCTESNPYTQTTAPRTGLTP